MRTGITQVEIEPRVGRVGMVQTPANLHLGHLAPLDLLKQETLDRSRFVNGHVARLDNHVARLQAGLGGETLRQNIVDQHCIGVADQAVAGKHHAIGVAQAGVFLGSAIGSLQRERQIALFFGQRRVGGRGCGAGGRL